MKAGDEPPDNAARGAGMTFTEAVVRFVRWLRAGYPDWAPGEGYLPLIALCGRDENPMTSPTRRPARDDC